MQLHIIQGSRILTQRLIILGESRKYHASTYFSPHLNIHHSVKIIASMWAQKTTYLSTTSPLRSRATISSSVVRRWSLMVGCRTTWSLKIINPKLYTLSTLFCCTYTRSYNTPKSLCKYIQITLVSTIMVENYCVVSLTMSSNILFTVKISYQYFSSHKEKTGTSN